ncbi:hypothetical protein Bca4012_011004 [Brassica carinata]
MLPHERTNFHLSAKKENTADHPSQKSQHRVIQKRTLLLSQQNLYLRQCRL